jgi:hypothetical protein
MALFGVQTTGITYLGVDPVSGRYRYYNLDTGLSSFSDTPPTAAQEQQYNTDQAAVDAKLQPSQTTYDSAQASVANQDPPAAAAAAVDPANQVTTQEQVNLDAPNYNAVQPGGYDPNSGDAYYTAGGYAPSETPSAETSTSSSTSEVSATGDTVTTTTNSAGGVNISGGSAPNSTTPDVPGKGPIMNPLHSYPSYTYGLSLHMLTIEEYNSIVQDQKYIAKRVLIASAGRYTKTAAADDPSAFIRAPYFDVDFYFENLNMKTIIGTNDHSRATNAIDISFTIVEPYGITLFNRIIKLCTDLKLDNYLETPYLLEIDFFASNDAGEIVGVIPGQTKRMPIQLTKFDIKVTSKGAEYSIQAVPYNHGAFNLSSVTTPAHFEVLAGSVASFFTTDKTETYVDDAKTQRVAFEQNATINADGTFTGATGEVGGSILVSNASVANQMSKDPIYRVKSYGTAINAWNKELVKNNKQLHPDTYKFNFHPDIGGANFKLSGKLSPKDTAMADVTDTISIRQGNTGKETDALNYNTKIFSINAGTSIEQVLNYVIRNSSYIQDQLIIPEEYTDPTKLTQDKLKNSTLPLRWFKVVPTVILDPNGYDKVRKTWARTIVYNVIPYEIYNTKVDVAPQGKWSDPLKVYNYYYTGKNIDIIDVNIEFNALYYTGLTAYRNNLATITGTPQDVPDTDQSNPQGYEGEVQNANAIQPNKIKNEVQNSRAQATGGAITPRGAASVDTEASVYTSAGGDMLQLTMKIIGDPQYIKQDDMFFGPGSALDSTNPGPPSKDPRLIADGSLHMDNREVYVQVTYRTPSDIDESTGLMNFDSAFQQSLFSGMYKVLSVDSTFSGGKFEQTLEMIRLFNQTKLDYVNQTVNPNNNARVEAGQSVPGSAAISPTNAVGPNYGAAVSSDATPPNSTPVADQDPVLSTPDNTALADVANNAPTQDITNQGPIAPNFQVSAYSDQTNSIGGTPATTQAAATSPDFTPMPSTNIATTENITPAPTTTFPAPTPSLAGQTVPSTVFPDQTVTYSSAGYPIQVTAADGSTSPVDALGNTVKPLINGSFNA